ncbi:MAG: sulfatase-like hydrolase/transferase [Bacteroidota bacterium]
MEKGIKSRLFWVVLFIGWGMFLHAQERPNVLFVFADQFRAMATGYSHEDPVITPNIDALAKEGVVFNHAVSSCPVCTPFRGMLISGKFPLTTGMTRNCSDQTDGMYLRPDPTAFGNAFKDNGYQTGYIGKWHLDDAQHAEELLGYKPDGNRGWDTWTPPGPKRQGFEFWHAYNAYDSHEAPHYWEDNTVMIEPGKWSPEHEADVAIGFMESRDKQKPFLLMLSINPPHPPFGQQPEKYTSLYDETDIFLNRKNVSLTGAGILAPDVVKDYFAAVTGVDDQFGRLVSYLKQEGIFDNTIIVFTADHGEMMGSQGRMYKSKWYEEAVNIPLLVSYPAKMQAGAVSECQVSPVDFLPTLLGLSGLEVPEGYDGKDLSPAFMDLHAPGQDTVFMAGYQGDPWSMSDSSWMVNGWRGVRTPSHTFVVVRTTAGQTCYLYDRVADRYQMDPLTAGLPEEREEFAPYYRSLKKRLVEMGDPYFEEGEAIVQPYSLMQNPGFETGSLSGWNNWGNGISNDAAQVFEGKWSGTILAGKTGSLQQAVELKSNTDYRVTIWAKVSAAGEFAKLIVKDYGGTKLSRDVNSTEYAQYSIDFRTGVISGPVSVSLYKANSAFGTVIADNFELYETGSLVTEISLSGADPCANVPVGLPYQVAASVLPVTALNPSLNWSIVNGTGEASVDSEGQVTGIASGTVVVVATATDGSNVTASYPIHVVVDPTVLNKITIESGLPSSDLELGQIVELSAVFDPEYFCNQGITWSVESLGGEAVINQEGLLRALGVGQVKIFAGSKADPAVAGELTLNLILGTRHTYYVDALSGSDTNDGLASDRAWQTLERVNAGAYSPGDSILFKVGQSWSGQLEVASSGALENPVVFTSYGAGEKPRLDGEGQKEYTIRLLNASYAEVSGFEVTNTGLTMQGGRYGVLMHAQNQGDVYQTVVRNIDVHDVNGDPDKTNGGGGGIVWKNEGETPSRFVDALIEGCHVYDCQRNGIVGKSGYTGGAYQKKRAYYNLRLKIRQNLIERVPGDGIVVLGCDSAVAEYNICRDFTDDLPDVDKNAAAGIWPWNSLNTVIQHNEVSGHMASWDAQGFDSDWNCDGTIIQYNYSHDNAGGFILICSNGEYGYNDNTVVRFNISVNDGFRTWGRGAGFCPSIHIAGNVYNTKIYNNTIYSGPKPASVDRKFVEATNWKGWSNVTYVYNNIFSAEEATGFKMANSRNYTFSHNFYSDNTLLPADHHPFTGDPQFVNPGTGNDAADYRLQAGSPANVRGIYIYDRGGEDFFGNPVAGEEPSGPGADNGNLVAIFPYEAPAKESERCFIIYPNPLDGQVARIRIFVPEDEVTVSLVSLTGERLETRKFSGEGEHPLGFRIDQYRPGMYLVVLESSVANDAQKILIL